MILEIEKGIEESREIVKTSLILICNTFFSKALINKKELSEAEEAEVDSIFNDLEDGLEGLEITLKPDKRFSSFLITLVRHLTLVKEKKLPLYFPKSLFNKLEQIQEKL